ncbi:MAG: cytidylate kinase [Porticoccus sp.]|jgi:cytidylate kinase|nr:cytidylate kinase [Porticoccus sp.]|tara:strand:- start:367 stop:1050 length:684 start_codon:yes stop_codon:yes gene_type:complete
MKQKHSPIVTVDGPSGAGKGTFCQLLAINLGFHYLDSGALYRLLALAAKRHKVDLNAIDSIALLAGHMDVTFDASNKSDTKIILEGEDVSINIRSEDIGADASIIAAYPKIRAALLDRQRAFVTPPGLIADGRDMGTVVFPDASTKIFLTASPEIRAKRRYNQLMDIDKGVSLAQLVEQVRNRDKRDTVRKSSPMIPADDAFIIDSSNMSIEEVLKLGLDIVKKNDI